MVTSNSHWENWHIVNTNKWLTIVSYVKKAFLGNKDFGT